VMLFRIIYFSWLSIYSYLSVLRQRELN